MTHNQWESSQERKARTFDCGLNPGLDQGEGLQGITRDQALVTELDEPDGNVCGIKPEIFRVAALANAPVSDGGCAHTDCQNLLPKGWA